MGICGKETDSSKKNNEKYVSNSQNENSSFSEKTKKPKRKRKTRKDNKEIENNFNYTINQKVFNQGNPSSNNKNGPFIEKEANKNMNESQIKKSQEDGNNIYPNFEELNQNQNPYISERKEVISEVATNHTIEKANQNLEEIIEIEREKEKESLIIKQNKVTKYDAIYSCESIKTLFDKGWNYTLFKSFIKRLQLNEDDRCFCPLCMIGETNKGKTFILNLLTNNKLDSGIQYRTEGISCKFTSFNEDNVAEEESDKKFLLFDTAGRSEPLLIDPEIKKVFSEEDFKRTVETNNRDLKLSEDFMKNLLIKNSKIIIVVVNQLSLAEQLFLFELKNEENYKQLFVIHNIFNFKKREEMENYIENTIINSIYFDLSKHYFDNYDDNNKETDNPYYFTEDLIKNQKQEAIITHLILEI